MAKEPKPLKLLSELWDSCKAEDDKKHQLVTDLFDHIHELSKKISEMESELLDKRDVIKTVRQSLEKTKKEVETLQHEKDRYMFALVVIDGDCMPFRDEFIAQGLEGGKRAASILNQAVEEELKSSVSENAHHLRVVVRVYANLKGLAKTYTEMEITPEPQHFEEFVRGFNMSDALCDFVDAGNGKECSDEKVKEIVKLHMTDVHCQQILFGGAADNGYARLLAPYSENEAVRKRITLLEGPPFAHELADIKDRFRTASFHSVFRNQKLLNLKRRVSFRTTPPPIPLVRYATAAAKVPPPSGQAKVASQSLTTSRKVSSEVLRNGSGQRVDSTLSYSLQDLQNLKNRKLCNSFYITGRCSFLDNYGNCQHEHGEKLTPTQLMALRELARRTACQKGMYCSDPDCIAGHRCPWEKRDRCDFGKSCRFPQEMHDVDTTIVSSY